MSAMTGSFKIFATALIVLGIALVITSGMGTKGPEEPQIVARAGQTFSVTLESNPSTGYRWQLAKPVDNSIITLVSSDYVVGEGELIGAGGEEIWTFKVIKSGRARIYFKYVRPWEKDVPPAKTRNIDINAVNPDL